MTKGACGAVLLVISSMEAVCAGGLYAGLAKLCGRGRRS